MNMRKITLVLALVLAMLLSVSLAYADGYTAKVSADVEIPVAVDGPIVYVAGDYSADEPVPFTVEWFAEPAEEDAEPYAVLNMLLMPDGKLNVAQDTQFTASLREVLALQIAESDADHQWNSGVELAPADCQNQGIVMAECKDCYAMKFSLINGSHTYGVWQIVTEPTCTEVGIRKMKCSVCGSTLQEEIDMLDHTPMIDEAVEPTCTEGGYTVPDEFERRLIQALEENNIFRQMATVIKTSSGDRKIPIVTSKGDAVWMDEEEQYTLSDDTFGQASLSAYKLGTMIKISNELLHDSAFDLASYIASRFGVAMGNAEERAFFTGDGDKKPLGILDETGGAQLGVETASQTAITFDEIFDLYYSLKSPYRRNAQFVCNETIILQLMKLKDKNDNYLWKPSLDIAKPDTLLGRPIRTSSFMPTIAKGERVLLFGDMKNYWVADRQNRTFRRLNELYARTDQVGFLTTQRVDGRLILPESVKVLKMAGNKTATGGGSNTGGGAGGNG